MSGARRGWVWFHRARALGWALLGVSSFVWGFANNIVLVWIASVYANVVSDIGAAEAADDRELVKRLDRIERLLLRESRRARSGRPVHVRCHHRRLP